MPGAQPVPGASMYPPQFQNGLRQGYGQQAGMASWGAAAVGGMPTAASTVGMLAGFGTMFTSNPFMRAASFLDPTTAAFEAGFARYGASRVAGMGMMGSLGESAMVAGPVGALAMAAMGTAKYGGQQYMAGAQQQLQLGNQLSGIGFANGGAMGGRGFGFNQQNQIGGMMRSLASDDPFVTMKDMSQSMDQFLGAGMHHGIQDAKEFSKKFKEFANSVKAVAAEIGTTLEEAGRIQLTMRRAGFYSAADVMGNSRQMKIAQGMGMEQEEFHGMQQQGANIARQYQMHGRSGAKSATRFAQSILTGEGTGLFHGEDLIDMTGAGSSSEAAAQLGTQFTGALAGYLNNSGAGRAMLVNLGKQEKDGSFSGGLDKSALANFAGGGAKLSQLASKGAGKLTGTQSRASFQANSNQIASSLLDSDQGMDAIMSVINQEADQHFKGAVVSDDARKLFYEKLLGIDKNQADVFLKMYKNTTQLRSESMKKLQAERSTELMQLEIARNYTLSGLTTQLTGGLEDFASPLARMGANATTGIQSFGQGISDSVMGIDRGDIDNVSRQSSLRRFASGTSGLQRSGLNVSDFQTDSVGGVVAAASGARSAMRMKQSAITGTLSLDQIGYSSGNAAETELNTFMATPQGQTAQQLIQRARMQSDPDKAAALREQARGLVSRGIKSIKGTSGTFEAPTDEDIAKFKGAGGNVNAATAALMLKLGDTGGAAEMATRGSVKSHTYGDVKSARDSAVSALTDLGVDSALADQMAKGGAGSELFTQIGGSGEGLDYMDNMRRALGKEGYKGDLNEEIAHRSSKRFGIEVSAADVSAVDEMSEQVKSGIRADWNNGAGWAGTAESRASRLASARGGFLSAADKSRVAKDTSVGSELFRSAGSALAAIGGDEEGRATKEALGDTYTKALTSLNAASSAGGSTPESIDDLDALVQKAGKLGLGGAYGELGQRRLRAEKDLSLKSISAAYGGTENDLTGFAKEAGIDISANGGLEKLLSKVSGMDALNTIGSGAGGGINLRGKTVEGQILFDLNATSQQVKATAEAIKAMQDSSPSGHATRLIGAVVDAAGVTVPPAAH